MLKRLRVKITAITMALIALLLLVILFSVCHFTWTYMEADAERAMQAASMEPLRPGSPANPNGVGRPCFVLSTDPDGELVVSGSAGGLTIRNSRPCFCTMALPTKGSCS